MEIADITFLLIIGIACLAFTLFVFIWRGLVWLSIISGLMWLLLGFFFNYKTQQGTEIMLFQEYMGIIFIGIGIVMMLSFAWLKAKNMDIEKNAPNDINIWGKEPQEDLREFGIDPNKKKKEIK